MKRSTLILAATLLLSSAAAVAAKLDTRWTRDALIASEKKETSLPELRVYDARGRLIYRVVGGFRSDTIISKVEAAMKSGKTVAGPTLEQAMAELETADKRPALSQVEGRARFIVVDYWADWCAPCKVLEKELIAWEAKQPAGRVLLVRAETDPTKLKAERGEKMIRLKYDSKTGKFFDQDGKEVPPPPGFKPKM